MNTARELLSRFIEQGSDFSTEELDSLLELLRSDPSLLVEFKDQLIVHELLAQRFDLTRYHFGLQVAQRIEDESSGTAKLRTDDVIRREDAEKAIATRTRHAFEKPLSPSANVAANTHLANSTPMTTAPVARRRSAARIAAGTFTLLMLVTIAAWYWPQDPSVATIESMNGDIVLTRFNQTVRVGTADVIRLRDRLITSESANATVRLSDGTRVEIDENSEVEFAPPDEMKPGRCFVIPRGDVSADVVPQPPGKPMLFQTRQAIAEVVGTSLRVMAAPEQTSVTVKNGKVRVERQSDHASLFVSKAQFAVVSAETLSVAPVEWPSDRKGLIFLFETNDRPNLVRSSSTGMNRSFSLRPRGRAHLNHDYGMVLTDGAFLAEDVDGEILASCRQSNELTVELTIRPELDSHVGEGPARIVTFSTTVTDRDFTIGQHNDRLVVRIRTPVTGPNGVQGVNNGVPVCTLIAGETHHLIISYKPGLLVCYLNGKLVFEGNQIQGDFRDWSAQHLLFGDEYAGGRNWAGELEGVALYNRFMGADEALRNAMQYQHLRQSRVAVRRIRVVAELTAKSTAPTMAQIQPHRSALLTCQYEVKQVLNGTLDQKAITVAQWALLDGDIQSAADLPVGAQVELWLERFELNPQAHAYLYSDDFALEDANGRFLQVP